MNNTLFKRLSIDNTQNDNALQYVPRRPKKVIERKPMLNGKTNKNRTKKPIHKKQKEHKSGNKEFPKDVSLFPKEMKTTPIFSYKRRYIATSNIFGDLTISALLNSFIVSTTAVLGNCLLQALRMRRLRIWAPVVTNGTPITVVITPVTKDPGNNCFSDLPETITDSSQTLDLPAFVDYKPEALHPSGSWHSSTTVDTNLVNVIAPTGSIMDIEFEAVLNTTFTTTSFTQVLVGATPGTIYARAVLTNFFPVGVNNI